MELMKIENDKKYGLVVTSRDLAKKFGKEHKHVIETLNKMTKNLNVGFSENTGIGSMLIKSTYTVPAGFGGTKELTQYLLTQDGFTLYMFNIQGYNKEKMEYMNEFNRMKSELENRVKAPSTYKEALLELVATIEEKEKLEAKGNLMMLQREDSSFVHIKTALKDNRELKNELDETLEAYENETVLYKPVDIIGKYNLKISSREFNKLVSEAGVIFKNAKGKWEACGGHGLHYVRRNVQGQSYKDYGFTEEGLEYILDNVFGS